MFHSSLTVKYKTLLIDAILVLLVLVLPIIAHITSIPFYIFDPMRLSVLGVYLLLRNKGNALVLAIALPILSFLISGHPIFIKNILISIELIINVLIIDRLLYHNYNAFASAMISIIVSKVLYYILKAALIYYNVLPVILIDTRILLQLVVTIIISIIFSRYYRFE